MDNCSICAWLQQMQADQARGAAHLLQSEVCHLEKLSSKMRFQVGQKRCHLLRCEGGNLSFQVFACQPSDPLACELRPFPAYRESPAWTSLQEDEILETREVQQKCKLQGGANIHSLGNLMWPMSSAQNC